MHTTTPAHTAPHVSARRVSRSDSSHHPSDAPSSTVTNVSPYPPANAASGRSGESIIVMPSCSSGTPSGDVERSCSPSANAAAATNGTARTSHRCAASDVMTAANANANASTSAGPTSRIGAAGPTSAPAVSPNHENPSVKNTSPLA